MRHITKGAEPASIRDWKAVQIPVGLNLDYRNFNSKPQLRSELVAEQWGLCAYTGAPIDDRLSGLHDENLAFQAHIEHVKPRAVCEAELVARGGVYGRELCEDLDFRNLVAALEVKRKPPSKSEIFGAASHGNKLLPVTPLQPNCQQRFRYDEYGKVKGLDDQASHTVDLLKLSHRTLEGWRRGAMSAFFSPDIELTREDIEAIISRMENPADGKLPEFCFCILSVAQLLLG